MQEQKHGQCAASTAVRGHGPAKERLNRERSTILSSTSSLTKGFRVLCLLVFFVSFNPCVFTFPERLGWGAANAPLTGEGSPCWALSQLLVPPHPTAGECPTPRAGFPADAGSLACLPGQPWFFRTHSGLWRSGKTTIASAGAPGGLAPHWAPLW